MTEPDGQDPVRVLIADDHEMYRRGMKVVLSLDPDIHVVGVAENGRHAVEQCAELEPDVVLMDVRMPDLDGIHAAHLITAAQPSVHVVMLSMSDDENDLYEALLAGALGYVPKDRPAEVIAAAVHSAHRGEPQLTPGVAARALAALARQSRPVGADEHEAISRLARGQQLGEVATAMGMEPTEAAAVVLGAMARLRRSDPGDG